ncbi:MAG: hypothetical protein IKR16_02385 [Firmicutes bacterium]|nr:hypothetical protein [Bacillota bacterium]
MEVVSILFGLIWMFVVITIIVKVASGASKAAKAQQQRSQRAQQMQQFRMPSQQSQGVRSQSGKVYDAQQESMDRARQAQSFRNVPGATYGSSNTGSRSAYSGYKSKPVDVKTQSVLFEDRKNDWLAKQFREEAALKRRAGADLGASHEVECAADELKRSHVRRHNTTGLNKSTFR